MPTGIPDDAERQLREMTKEIAERYGTEPTPLERLAAAKRAEKRARRRRRGSRALTVLAVLVLLAGGGAFAWLRVHPLSWLRLGSIARPTATTRTSPKSSLVSPVNPGLVSGAPTDPFAGSPADPWAAGAAGIALPAARAHGPYTTTQVESALRMTRELLIAGNLDWPTLRGGAPTAFVRLLAAHEREQFLKGLHEYSVEKDGTENNTRTWVTSFAPGTTQFVTTVVKVHGTMSPVMARNSGTEVLRIRFDYWFVFAVQPPGKPADWERVVQQQYGTVDFARWDDPGGQLEPWITVSTDTAGVECGGDDGYLRPDFPQASAATPQPTGKPVDPYATPAPSAPAGCSPATRT